jgi:hypothetical protein
MEVYLWNAVKMRTLGTAIAHIPVAKEKASAVNA